jgi:predicted amino acid racemase
MVELGDLREGIMPDDLATIARTTRDLPNLVLRGIGANLACRSGVVPDAANMAELSGLAALVEHSTDVALDVVSGGNSANLGWALGPGATGRINDLRLGEALLLGRDPVERLPVEGLRTDAVTLVAEVIESGAKPSLPWGTTAQTAFGERPRPVDHGEVVQTILALGRQDTDTSDLAAPAGMTIVASSSDHLVTWTDERLAPGTEVPFAPGYSAVLRAMTSPTVETVYVSEAAERPVPALK